MVGLWLGWEENNEAIAKLHLVVRTLRLRTLVCPSSDFLAIQCEPTILNFDEYLLI